MWNIYALNGDGQRWIWICYVILLVYGVTVSTSKQTNLTASCDLETGRHVMCFTPGENYPWYDIEVYIEDHRGTVLRMFGSETDPLRDAKDDIAKDSAAYRMREISFSKLKNPCVSDVSLEQPYWSKNQKGQLRVIVNHSPFEQFVQIEKCISTPDEQKKIGTKPQSKCPSDGCFCMQEYRSIRLVAYDPAQDEKGIFMDWFEFPCCCQCKCKPDSNSNTTFARDLEREDVLLTKVVVTPTPVAPFPTQRLETEIKIVGKDKSAGNISTSMSLPLTVSSGLVVQRDHHDQDHDLTLVV